MIIQSLESVSYMPMKNVAGFCQTFSSRPGEVVYYERSCAWYASTAARCTSILVGMFGSTNAKCVDTLYSASIGKRIGQTILESALSLARDSVLVLAGFLGRFLADLLGYSLAYTAKTNPLSDEPEDHHYRRDPCDFFRVCGLCHA